MGMFHPAVAKTPDLFDPGRHITAGYHALVYGVRVVCNETAPRIDLSKACDTVPSVSWR